MKTNSRQRSVIIITFCLLCLLPLIFHLIGLDYLTSVATKILIYALVGVSLDLIIGTAGLVSFGHAAFFGLGAYVCGVLMHHQANDLLIFSFFQGSNNALICWSLALLSSLVLGLIIGVIALRTSGAYFIMITLALAQMMYYLIISIPQFGGEDGLSLWQRNDLFSLDLSNDIVFYYVCLCCLLTYLILCLALTKSTLGLVIKGCKFNAKRMITMGYSPFRYQLFAFAFSAMGAGLAGAMMVNLNQYVSPDFLHWNLSGQFLIIVILGGIGSLYGGFYGALFLLGLEELLSNYTDHWHLIIGIILVVMVLTAKNGFYASIINKQAS